jgi:hypothetical protein
MIYLFIVLAAICKAVADTLQHHFSTSVFKYKDPRFWNPAVSWQHAHRIRFTKYPVDAWHLSNSLMIIFFCAAAVSGTYFKWWIDISICGVLFNVVFNYYYNKALR